MIDDTHVHEDGDGHSIAVDVRVFTAATWERESKLLGPGWAWSEQPGGLFLATRVEVETATPLLYGELAVASLN